MAKQTTGKLGGALVVKMALVVGAILLLLGWWFEDSLPAAAVLTMPSRSEPVQQSRPPEHWLSQVQGVDYQVEAVADYEISGLVVSGLRTDAWFARHEGWNEFFNVMDVCMVWGKNAQDGAYEKMAFHSGQWTCYAQTSDGSVNRSEYWHSLSNTHMVTDDAQLAKRIRDVRIGDQVHFRGQLVNYSHGGRTRTSSLRRDDDGNGACEILYVTEMQVLAPAAKWPRWLWWLGILCWVAAVWVFVRTPHRESA